MPMSILSIFFAILALHEVNSSPAQAPMQAPVLQRKLNGRFLHLTDLHPDPYYVAGASVKKACHRLSSSNDDAGFYGTPYTDCDSPIQLVNFTLDHLEENWVQHVDFVVITGDNARHDDDPKLPRTLDEIYQLNQYIASKVESIFTQRGIPVIPSLGNNDVWPHNTLSAGPNQLINEFSSIWSPFIPSTHRETFKRGAYFSVDVVPDALAVISLNTMYFYDANTAVNGCGFKDPDDPGNLQFDWLASQLESLRSRAMQVWITGHVPPSSANYFPECYTRYVDLALRYQDTILGHLYGHMNADHFFFVEGVDLSLVTESKATKREENLCEALLRNFSQLPKANEIDLDTFGVINVSPPVVPAYLPSHRVFSYNVSSSAMAQFRKKKKGPKRKPTHPPKGGDSDQETLCKQEPYMSTWKCHLPAEKWHSDSDSPSRKNTLWSPLGYAQYYLPNLLDANSETKPVFKLEYMTFDHTALEADIEGRRAMPLKNLPKSLREGPKKSKYLPYEMKDLTIGSWIEIGRRLAEPASKILRNKFCDEYMFLGAD
ncbi:Metallo-dependent phosphatase-like protein [Mycena floridula]|nr:Metallo-dependent phosphatase-like protein [Mycena floridula]